jgi:hypothetical protein
MKNSTQNKARQIVVSSTAPAPVDLKAALEPAAFKAAVEKPHAQDMQAFAAEAQPAQSRSRT